jgi:hypothetical protein
LVEVAQERAQEIEAEAHRRAEEIISETDEYIVDQLSELEEQLLKTLTIVRNGLRFVRESQHAQPVEPVPVNEESGPVETN